MSLVSWLRAACSDATIGTTPIFEHFCKRFDDHYTVLKSQNLKDLKKNIGKAKGDVFEELCYQLLREHAFPGLKLNFIWKFADLPIEYRTQLSLSNRDMGIDLVGCTDTQWVAIQCKYRKKPNKSRRPDGAPIYWQVPWAELSTFVALCARTGPWGQMVVLTSAESCRWQGRRDPRCTTYARGTFLSIGRNIWDKLAGDPGHTLTGTTAPKSISSQNTQTQQEVKDVREKRAAWLDKLGK